MAFNPDILVTERGSSQALLVVEAKATRNTVDAERQLRQYMWEMSCPVGLLATTESVSLYRNLFTGYSEHSIEKVGVFASPPSWRKFGTYDPEFEFHVQTWLEALTEGEIDLPSGAADAFEQLVIPGLLNGEVHAAGPRLAR